VTSDNGYPEVAGRSSPPSPNSFAGNVLKLVSGSTAAQIMTVLTAPFIARMFAPEAFGAAALFAALTGVVSAVVGLRYELSIVLPESDEDAVSTGALSLCFVALTTLISSVLLGLFGNRLLVVLRATELRGILWLAPINIFLSGVSSTLMYWNIRKKRFGIQGIAQVAGAAFFVVSQIIAGLRGYRTGDTIILATVFSAFISTVILGVQAALDSGSLFVKVKWGGMLQAMRRYSSFPKYSTASAVLNNIGWQVPTFLLSAFFSTEVVGYYALGNKLLRLPVSLIGANIATVFFQHASEVNRKGMLQESVDKIFRYMVHLFLFPSLILTFVGKDLFLVVFGAKWAEAGVYSQLLSLYVLFWFMAVPMGITLNVLEKQALELRLIILVLIARVLALIIGGRTGSPRIALALFAIAGVLLYGFYFYVVIRHCGGSYSRLLGALGRQIRLFLPAALLIVVLQLSHVHAVTLLAASAVMLLVYYLSWIRSDPEVRGVLATWKGRCIPARIGSEPAIVKT